MHTRHNLNNLGENNWQKASCSIKKTHKPSPSFWSFLVRLFSCFNVFKLLRKSSPSSSSVSTSQHPETPAKFSLNLLPTGRNVTSYSEVNKNKPVYNTTTNYNYPLNGSNYQVPNAYKSKHSTPIRVQQELKLNLISPVLPPMSSMPIKPSDEANSIRNSCNLAYIDADSQSESDHISKPNRGEDEEETYDNVPSKQSFQQNHAWVI